MDDLTFNQRQYKRMIWTLDDYEKGLISLNTLTSNLIGLLNVLEGVSSDWEASFRTAWSGLEHVYADVLNGPIPLDNRQLQIVAESIAELRRLIKIADPSIADANE